MKKKIGKDLLDAKLSQQLLHLWGLASYTYNTQNHWHCYHLNISTQLAAFEVISHHPPPSYFGTSALSTP